MNILSKLKQFIFAAPANLEREVVMAHPIEHPILGSLQLHPDKRFSDTLVGKVAYGGDFIEIDISADDRTMEEVLDLAVSTVASLASLDGRCRELIADDALEGYNNSWRFGAETLPDGSSEEFEKPFLSKAEFCSNLKFKSFEATGTMLTFWYDDNDMFWGHSLYVSSFDGVSLKDVSVSMFG